MSAHKKHRSVVLVTPLQAHLAEVSKRWGPEVVQWSDTVRTRLQLLRDSRTHEAWLGAKQAGLVAIKAMSNQWIAHCSDLATGASSRALYTSAFGPISDVSDGGSANSLVDSAALLALEARAHRLAAVAAEGHLQQMRNALQKMRTVYDTLHSHVQSLEVSWCDLHALTSGDGVVVEVDEEVDGEKAALMAAALEQLHSRSTPLSPTDLPISTNASTNLQQMISSLSSLARMYRADLHTKHALVDALARLISSDSASLVGGGESTSGGRLLQPPPPSATDDANQSPPLFSSSASTLAQTLEMYVAAWMMEPDISNETLVATAHLLETELA